MYTETEWDTLEKVNMFCASIGLGMVSVMLVVWIAHPVNRKQHLVISMTFASFLHVSMLRQYRGRNDIVKIMQLYWMVVMA